MKNPTVPKTTYITLLIFWVPIVLLWVWLGFKFAVTWFMILISINAILALKTGYVKKENDEDKKGGGN